MNRLFFSDGLTYRDRENITGCTDIGTLGVVTRVLLWVHEVAGEPSSVLQAVF